MPSRLKSLATVLSVMLVAAMATGAVVSPAAAQSDGALSGLGIEIEQEETVQQGGDATITGYPYNQYNQSILDVSTELQVDANGDGQFDSSEVFASKNVTYPTDASEVNLTASNVQLAAGSYEYRIRAEKNGDVVYSYTNGTLTVESGSSSGPTSPLAGLGIEIEQEETVQQGGNVTITGFPNNMANQSIDNVSTELRVDVDGNGDFNASEVFATRTVSVPTGASQVDYALTNVQLANGSYEYRIHAEKNGDVVHSFTNGTLTVGSGSSPATAAGNTTVKLRLDSAPYGIRLMNVTVTATNSAAIVSPPSAPALGSVPLKNSEIERGGVDATNVTVRTVSTGSTVSTDAVTLLNLSFAGTVNESDLTYTVTTLTNTNGSGTGDPIDPARVSLDVTQPEPPTTVFSGPAPGISGAEGAPNDADGDGKFEDVNGDGETDFSDVLDFAFSLSSTDRLTAEQKAAFNFDGDSSGDISFSDVISLAFNLGA